MTEYWQSQARKFCDFCKCWIADQKVSIEFHESGKRHQQAVKDRLRDIGQKGLKDERKNAKEEQWLKQIEQQAMKDYRNKDLQENSDLTAKIFNEKRCERDNERLSEGSSAYSSCLPNTARGLNLEKEEDISRAESFSSAIPGPGPPSWGVPSKSKESNSSCTKNPFDTRVSAKTHGTKYHNPPPDTNWREALTKDGNTYYWHTISHTSVWEPPAEGYTSIKEQEKILERQRMNDLKVKRIRDFDSDENPKIPTKHSAPKCMQGPAAKPDPYGSWQKVSEDLNSDSNISIQTNSSVIDYQTPEIKQAPSTNVVLHNDRTKKFEIGSKKTPSLKEQDDDFQVDYSAGIKPSKLSKLPSAAEQADSLSNAIEAAKPSIVFRKRKVNSIINILL